MSNSRSTCSASFVYSKLLVSQNPQISFKIVTSTITCMYLNAGTKMHEKVAALNAVHYIPSKLLIIVSIKLPFSKRIYLKDLSTICF